MAGQTQSQVPELPVVEWNVEIEIQGEVKRNQPITAYTLKGMIRHASKMALIQKYLELEQKAYSCPAPIFGAGGVQVLRLLEVSPNCQPLVKVKGYLEPVINLFGQTAMNFIALQKAGINYNEYLILSPFMRPRIKVVMVEHEEEVEKVTQGIIDDINGVATGNPHELMVRKVPLIKAKVMLIPSIYDYMKIPEICEFVPKAWYSKSYHEAHKEIIQEGLKYLVTHPEIDALGGRALHLINIKVEPPKEVKKIKGRKLDINAWNSLIQKLAKVSICQCNRQLLTTQQNPHGAPRYKPW